MKNGLNLLIKRNNRLNGMKYYIYEKPPKHCADAA